jgi:ATPase subunit of ABC transporter with duplicated ATPase domains
VQNPTTSLNDDVAAVKRALAQQDGPVILVAHSFYFLRRGSAVGMRQSGTQGWDYQRRQRRDFA